MCFFYTISSCSIYKNNEAIVTAGKTKPTRGTKIEGRYEALIVLILNWYDLMDLDKN